MSTESVVMVQIANREWTLEALHCACLLARNTSARIALVKMIPVQHASWLGTEWGYMYFTPQEQADFTDYQATIEDYGVPFTPLMLQYVTLAEATIQAAEHVNAQIVFARIPESRIPLWTKFQRRLLTRQLARQKRQWIQYPAYNPDASSITLDTVAEIKHH
jgi:hypothetical protein